MNQNTNNNPEPKAWIATDGSRKKIKNDNNVYLKDQEQFEIELFNPTTNKVLAKISINGKFVSDSGLVLNPGQRYFMKRFIDENKAFLFSTYEVDSTDEESKKAIADNGKVEVYFYSEYKWTNNQNTGLVYWGGTFNPTNYNPTYYGGTLTGTSNITALFTNCSNTSFTNAGSVNTGITNTGSSNNIETGRVDKGNVTDQTFGKDHGTYNAFHSFLSSYQLLPESRMPLEVTDIKVYCTECGKKAGNTDNFCAKCGNNLKK